MFTVKIMNEFIHSPLWIYDEDSIIDEPEFIANDARSVSYTHLTLPTKLEV